MSMNTVKPEYNDQPRDQKIVAVVGRWSLFWGGRWLSFECTERQKVKLDGLIWA